MELKIVTISDTHGQKFSHLIPECDVLIHAGDVCPNTDHSYWYQNQWLTGSFLEELKKVNAKHIIFIMGNHDYAGDEYRKSHKEDWFRKQLPSNVHYLRDSGVTIDGISFWGTPWVVNLPRWAFSKQSPNDDAINFPKYKSYGKDQSDELREIYSSIPENLDFLISHGPAYGFCDQILEFGLKDHIGCKPLTEAILQKKPKYVISGHIHSANHNGEKIIHNLEVGTKTELFCTSVLDESYKIKYSPKIIEI